MLSHSLAAFAAELEKLSAPLVDDTTLTEVLQPGDILHTAPRRFGSLLAKLEHNAIALYTGTHYTHAGMYVGDGKVIDSNDWPATADQPASLGVTTVPLQTFKDRYKFKVLRPDVSTEQRQDAVAYAKTQVGTPFNMRGLIRHVLPGKSDRAGFTTRKAVNESLYCSELISNAYHDANLVPAKKNRHNHVTPADLANSPHVNEIAEYK